MPLGGLPCYCKWGATPVDPWYGLLGLVCCLCLCWYTATACARLRWSATLPMQGWDVLLEPEKAYRMKARAKATLQDVDKGQVRTMVVVLDGYSALVCNRNFL